MSALSKHAADVGTLDIVSKAVAAVPIAVLGHASRGQGHDTLTKSVPKIKITAALAPRVRH